MTKFDLTGKIALITGASYGIGFAIAKEMLESLLTNYTTKELEYSNGFLTDSMFNRNAGHKPECSLWGDYYVMEAVYRMLNPN